MPKAHSKRYVSALKVADPDHRVQIVHFCLLCRPILYHFHSSGLTTTAMTALDPAERAGQSRKLAAARASIAASALLALAKLVAGLWSGSLALLSEAGHAFVDTGATVRALHAGIDARVRGIHAQSAAASAGDNRVSPVDTVAVGRLHSPITSSGHQSRNPFAVLASVGRPAVSHPAMPPSRTEAR